MCVCVFPSVFPSMCHTDFSTLLSPFGEFEVLLELAWQGHAVFWVSGNFMQSFKKFHTIFTQFHIILAISAIFCQLKHDGYQNACTWVEKFNGDTFMLIPALPHAILRNIHAILAVSVINFWPISTFLYQNACTQAEKFNDDTFTHIHPLLQTISRNFHAISRNFGYFSYFWSNLNMLGININVLQLRNSMVILSYTFTHSLMQFYAIFTQFYAILAISAIIGPISTCWVSKCMYLSWETQWWYW